VFENRKLTADRVFYVPGVKEDSWNKVPATVLTVPSVASSAPRTLIYLLLSAAACLLPTPDPEVGQQG
jgi:hypothetical protein